VWKVGDGRGCPLDVVSGRVVAVESLFGLFRVTRLGRRRGYFILFFR